MNIEFLRYESTWNMARAESDLSRWRDRDDFYDDTFKYFEGARNLSPQEARSMRTQVWAEQIWYLLGRPYYNVWPCIGDMIVRLPDSTPVVRPDMSHLTYRKDPGDAESVAVLEMRLPLACLLMSSIVTSEGHWAGWCGIQLKDKTGDNGRHRLVFSKNWRVESGDTLGDVLDRIRSKGEEDSENVSISELVGRLLAMLGLLQDPSLGFLERDVCSKDRGKPPSEAILRRATARKGLGWDLGRSLELVPHTRRPHWSVRWMRPEEGESAAGANSRGLVPRLRPIKGSVVKRSKMAEVPTGWDGKPDE